MLYKMDRKPLCSTRGNRGGGSATATGGGRSPPTRDGRVARDAPPRRRARRLRGNGVCAHRKKRGRTWNVFSARGRHVGRVRRERGVENEGQHGARGTLREAGGAFDARTPAGIARGTRSSNVLNIPPTKCPAYRSFTFPSTTLFAKSWKTLSSPDHAWSGETAREPRDLGP